jgi:SSS family solute:Na+ symporter
MVPIIVVSVYLLVTLYIGVIAFRKGKSNTEDFFLANRTIGPMVFFMSLFATNMTAFAILGSSGLAFKRGIGVYGLMASSSGFMIPLTIFIIGTRLWSLGKRFGHMTQVQFFRDRWECSGIGTGIFCLSVAMLVPYMIISIMGGGRVLHDISAKKGDDGKVVMLNVMKDGQQVMVDKKIPVKGDDGKPVMVPAVKDGKPVLKPDGSPVLEVKTQTVQVPKMEPDCYVSFELGALIVAIAVTSIVFFGGMRGTVWVNIFQTLLFLLFGTVAVAVIGGHLPHSFTEYFTGMADDPTKKFMVTRIEQRMSEREFWSYSLIPLSSIMFPHMSIMCLSAKKVSAFKRTVVLYPLAIMAIWLPCIFLGVIASQALLPGAVQPGAEDGVLLVLLGQYAHPILAGILGAGIISAVMGSDCHQVLAISTMFTKDLFQYYGGKEKYGEKGGVWFARAFIIILTIIAYCVALVTGTGIFELAIRYAFSGFAAMAPVMLAALFWKRSTKWGALASTFYVAASLVFYGYLQYAFKAGDTIVGGGDAPNAIPWLISMPITGDIRVKGFMTVVPMVFGSALFMVFGSLLTSAPSIATLERYFPSKKAPGSGAILDIPAPQAGAVKVS